MARTFEHILIPYNGTTGSNKAFRKAVSLSSSTKAKITILTGLERRSTFALFRSKARNDELEKEKKIVEKQHLEMKKFAEEHDVVCDSKVVRVKSLASSEILSFAEQKNIDLIIMSKTKLSSRLEKTHYHSTLENVFRNARCPIMIL